MPDRYRNWLANNDLLQILTGYNANNLDEDEQVILEKLVENPSNTSQSRKMAKVLGKKPLIAKMLASDIATVESGMGRISATDPFIAENSNEHPHAGR